MIIKSTLKLVLLCTIILCGNAKAQYDPELLIPYNSGNLWGWCDTLGTVLIEPKFEESTFFTDKYIKNRPLAVFGNSEKGFYFVKPDGNLLFPSHLRYFPPSDHYTFSLRELIILKSQNNKKTIFSTASEAILLDSPQDEVYLYTYNKKQYAWMKQDNEKYYKILNSEQKILKTKIVNFIFQWNDVIFTETEKRRGYLLGDSLKYMSRKESKRFEELGFCSLLEPNPPFPPPSIDIFKLVNKNSEAVQDFIKTFGKVPIDVVSYLDSSELYFSVKEGEKEGVMLQSGQVLVPIEFDKIEFTYSPQGISLQKNGVYGFMPIPAKYKPIEAKYQVKLTLEENFASKTFRIYKVKVNGKTVYVGENEVEYFTR